jgi:hypothetical protein
MAQEFVQRRPQNLGLFEPRQVTALVDEEGLRPRSAQSKRSSGIAKTCSCQSFIDTAAHSFYETGANFTIKWDTRPVRKAN